MLTIGGSSVKTLTWFWRGSQSVKLPFPFYFERKISSTFVQTLPFSSTKPSSTNSSIVRYIQNRILTRFVVEFCTAGSPRSAFPFFNRRDSQIPMLSGFEWQLGDISPRIFAATRMQMSKDSRSAKNKTVNESRRAIDARESILDRREKETRRCERMRYHEPLFLAKFHSLYLAFSGYATSVKSLLSFFAVSDF